MSRDSSGTYTAPTNTFNPAVEGTEISQDDWNDTLTDLETALTDSLDRTGKGKITAYVDFDEVTAPSSPAANVARLYSADNGSGVTKLYAKDSAGTVSDLTAGASVLAFKTISVSGQSDVVADSATDTLTIAAGSNVTITTDATTDTITIAASGGGGSGTQTVNAQTGTSYAILGGDSGKLITASNASAQAYTIAQAGTGSFTSGYWVDIRNKSTAVAGIVTITPTTSTINGAATLKIHPGQSCRIVSDGTNYQVSFLANAAQVPGTTTNDAANAGNVGEYLTATLASGSAVSLTSNTVTDIISVSLTAGDWDVQGWVWCSPTGTMLMEQAWISTTSITRPTPPTAGFAQYQMGNLAGADMSFGTGNLRVSLSGTANVYLTTKTQFSSGTCGGYGMIVARRVR